LAPFFDSFELLDGEVLGELVADVEVARGVGWQVRDGVLESAAYGLRAEAGGRWRLVVGADLQRFSPEAEVGFETPEAVLYVVPDRVADPLGWQTRKLAGFVEQFEDVEKLPLRILGEDIDTLVATIGPHQQRFGTLCHEGLCLQIAMAYPAEAAETVADDLHDPPILEWMAPGRVSALRREMLEDPVWEAAMGRDYVLRRGDFVHFAAGVRWTAPPGLWRLRTGDAASALGAGVLLGFEEPILGVRGQISVEEPPEPTGDEAVETARGLEVRSTADTVVAVRRNDAVVLDVITGAPELKELAKRGLAVEPAGLLDAGSFNGVFRDLRLGFSTRHEALGFALEDRTPPTAADRARILRFSREREVVYVLGLYEDDAEGDLLARRMQRLIQVTLGREVDGEAERSDGTLADQPGVSLTWPATGREVIGAITTRDRFAYAVVAIGYGFGATADFRGAVAGFALL
jgi:hypothetical protein